MFSLLHRVASASAVALSLFVMVAIVLSAQALPAAEIEKKPNILFILTDDQGYGDLGWAGRLHCCRYNRPYMEGLFESAGLSVAHFSHRTQTDGQSLYLLSKA